MSDTPQTDAAPTTATIEDQLTAVETALKTLTDEVASLKAAQTQTMPDAAEIAKMKKAIGYLCGRGGINPDNL